MSITPKDAIVHIREVWAHNFEQELQLIREIIEAYPHLVTEDKEILGFGMEPDGTFLNGCNIADYHYPTMRANADSMKLILKLELRFSDEGNLPSCGTTDNCVWEFNFTDFNPNKRIHDSAIELLQQNGINFQRVRIREVWADNLEQEFQFISEIMHDYPYLAMMDTQFLGCVVKSGGKFFNGRNIPDYHCPIMTAANADSTNLIQLGLTFSNKKGELPSCGTTENCMWRFNFRDFNVNENFHEYDAIKLLQQSAIDFQANAEQCIDSQRFRELLMSSGIMLNENIHWTPSAAIILGCC